MTDQCTAGQKYQLTPERETKMHSSVAEEPRGKGQNK